MHATTIHRVGCRDTLFMGGDRELVMFSGLLSFTLIFAMQELVATLAGLGLWFCSLFMFRLMAKTDPKMRHVYLRHIRYRMYYPAHSTPFRNSGSPR